MIDVSNAKCIFKSCLKSPNFNFYGEKKRLYCIEHKIKGMIGVSYKRCRFKSCLKRPYFNFKDEKNIL